MSKLEKLEKALTDLQGFAERNVKRAEEALKDARSSDSIVLERTQEARLHEAQRFLLVVRDRIAEARA